MHTSRPRVGSKDVPTIDFTSSRSLAWVAGNLWMQFTLTNYNQHHVAAFHQSKVDCPMNRRTFCGLCRCCDLHVHDCVSEGWQFSSMRCSPAQFKRRRVVFGCSLGPAQLRSCAAYSLLRSSLCVVSLGAAPDTHGPKFSPCSEPPGWLARQHVAASPQHRFRRSHQLYQFLNF